MYKRKIKIILMLNLMMLMFCGNGMSSDLNNKMGAIYNFNFNSVINGEIINGHDIFIKDDSLFAIVWKATGIKDISYDSRLLIKKKDSEEWRVIDIPGKAYYLGAGYNHEICSIKQDMEKKTWYISFYDLDGKKLHEIEHKYRTFSKEYLRYEPVPLCYDDGSLIFYTIYKYETLKAFLAIFYGDHDSASGVGEYIEIVPELMNKANKRNSFSYVRITDRSKLRWVFPANENPPQFDSIKKRDFTSGDYKIAAYELEDKENNYYLNNNKLIKVSDKIEIIDINTGNRVYLPKPPIDNKRFIICYSDIWAESDDLFLSMYEIYPPNRIIIYFYDGKKKQWSRDTIINPGPEGYRRLTIYKKDDYLYMGLWGGYQNFRIIKYKI